MSRENFDGGVKFVIETGGVCITSPTFTFMDTNSYTNSHTNFFSISYSFILNSIFFIYSIFHFSFYSILNSIKSTIASPTLTLINFTLINPTYTIIYLISNSNFNSNSVFNIITITSPTYTLTFLIYHYSTYNKTTSYTSFSLTISLISLSSLLIFLISIFLL